MPPILFPASSAPGKDAIEGAGRLVNAYSERLQDGAPAQYAIRRAPGTTAFCTTSETGFRGMWYDGTDNLYAAWFDELFWIDINGVETSVGALGTARLTFLTSVVDTTNTTAYTYSAVSIGAANALRRIIVGVMFDDDDDFASTTVTVGGVAATFVTAGALGSADGVAAIYIALLATGTTADIVVTYGTAAVRSAIGVWRLDGSLTSTPVDTTSDNGSTAVSGNLTIPRSGGVAVAAAYDDTAGGMTWPTNYGQEDFDDTVESAKQFSGASYTFDQEDFDAVGGTGLAIDASGNGNMEMAGAAWANYPPFPDTVTFAKNNASPTPDQVLCSVVRGSFTFTKSAITALSVNSELANSVCFGEGYFFFTTPGGKVYASNVNSTTVTGTDFITAEQRPEPAIRGIYWNGELYVFCETHTEVWASNGNANATGFPLNYTTTIWRGLIAPLAVTGFEEGFEGGLFWVADDNSVRLLNGYTPQTISTNDVERAIEDCTNKSSIRMFCYDLNGHACVVLDLAGEATWVYDLTEGGAWHERKTFGQDYWQLTGNSVKAFGKWLAGSHDNGNIYQIDPDAKDEAGTTLRWQVESIAMEKFPERLAVSRADFNFVSGVGDASTPDPEVQIQWSDDGGHRWSNPVTRKLGENGRYHTQVRVNRLGLTGVKGRRFRLTVDDPVYVGLLAGNMDVQSRPG